MQKPLLRAKPRAVIGNVRENTIIDMLPDRQRVKIVTMDMWTPYRDAARVVLPGATVVVDKFHVVRMANAALEAERYYGAWETTVMGDDVAWAYKDLMTAMRNWRPEILNYFDHRVTNAFIESMNNLIRLMNRIGRGYSFERKQRMPDDEIGYGVPDDSMGRWTPPVAAAAGRNLGTDVATLIAMLESDSL